MYLFLDFFTPVYPLDNPVASYVFYHIFHSTPLVSYQIILNLSQDLFYKI